MPTVLRRKSEKAPGVISFTHNEALWGPPAFSPQIQRMLVREENLGRWIFGVHVQGDCSFLDEWPLQGWEKFFMWPNVHDRFLRNVDPKARIALNCINFMPEQLSAESHSKRPSTDVIVISRPAAIKGIDSTMLLLKALLRLRPSTTVTLIVPDTRIWSGLRRRIPKGTDTNFFKSARSLFSSQQLAQISFISTSQEAFGRFPLTQAIMIDLIASSRLLLLNSVSEGTPRALAEALLLGLPCAVPRNLRSGLDPYLDRSNCIRFPDGPEEAASVVAEALNEPGRWTVDRERLRLALSEKENLGQLRSRLSNIAGESAEDAWCLNELHVRLACHGQKVNYQIVNSERALLDWFARVESASELKLEMSEDVLFPDGRTHDSLGVVSRARRDLGRARGRFARSRQP